MNISESNGTVTLSVYVQPRASRTELVGEHGEALKVRLAAPPVDGAANEELTRYFAKLLGVPAGSVRIKSGQSSRTKMVEISGASMAAVLDTIEKARKTR